MHAGTAGLEEVEGAVAHPGVFLRDDTPGSRISVLPISRNTPPGATRRSEASTKSPASESSTTSMPRPPVTARNLSSNSQRARIGDMVVVKPHRPQRVPLATAGGSEHLQPQMAGQLHRRHPHPTGRGMHQHPLPRL